VFTFLLIIMTLAAVVGPRLLSKKKESDIGTTKICAIVGNLTEEGLDIVGIYPNYAQAYDAWKEAAHRTVDDAHMRYFIVHLHRLLDPEHDSGGEKG